MRARTLILLACVIVVVLIVIYVVATDSPWSHGGFWMAHFVESAEKVYRRSGGRFDEAAQLALRRIADRRDPTPADHLLAATIITRNVIAQEHRPELLRDGRVAPRALEMARLRRGMFDQARFHYTEALNGLGTMTGAAGAASPERAGAALGAEAFQGDRRGGQAPAGQLLVEPGVGTGYLLDAATEFAFDGMAMLLEADPLNMAWFAGEWEDEPLTPLIDLPLARHASQLRGEVVQARQQAAATIGGDAPGARTSAYLNLAVEHTDDQQNVHDTTVNACLKSIVGRLRAEQQNQPLPSLAAIRAEILANGAELSKSRPQLVTDALAVVNRALDNEKNIAIDATDGEVLRRVWARADDPRNAGNRAEIRQAVFDALVDCWSPGIQGRKIECVNGRTARNLGALVLLDHDPRNWEIKRLEQLKNDIFTRAGAVIEAEARKAAESDDPKLRAVGQANLAKTAAEIRAIGELDPAVEAAFNERLRGAIASMVDTYTAERNAETPGAVPDYLIPPIKSEASAAVM